MSTGDLGTLAAVRHAMEGWVPAQSAETVGDRRANLQRHLRSNLDAARRVETHRTSTLPDVVVDGTVGVLFAEEVSERTADRTAERLDRFDGAYPLLFVVGLDVRDWSVWNRLRDEYATSDPTIGRTEFVFESLASLRASGTDWGNWRDEASLKRMLVPAKRTVAYYVLACLGILGADLLVRYATDFRPVLPSDPGTRVVFVLTLVAVAYLAHSVRSDPSQG